jgi:hypothetical protein
MLPFNFLCKLILIVFFRFVFTVVIYISLDITKIRTERQRDRETERQRDRETERQRDRETERQRTERKRDRETKRQKNRKTQRY